MRTLDTLRPGLTLGRYEYLLPIAQGGMASVWAARSTGARGFKKTVTIKTMLPSLSLDEKFEQMFLDEARIAARIQHPNVVEILDLGEQDQVLYIVMEWLDGESLHSVFREAFYRGRVPLPVAIRIALDVCGGLHAAHELKDDAGTYLGLVHRDVTPQNIIVTYDGLVKVVDFGVAKVTEGATRDISKAGQIAGKFRYMAPEYVQGKGLDRRADVFSLGIVLYQLTTGRHPWEASTNVDTLRRIMTSPPRPPRSIVSQGYPDRLEAIILRAIERDPDHRFQTAAEMFVALESCLDGEAPATSHDVASYLRELLGAQGEKRREALRSAIRDADLRAQERSETSYPSGAFGFPSTLSRLPVDERSESIPPLPREVSAPPLAHTYPASPGGGRAARLAAAARWPMTVALVLAAGVGLGVVATHHQGGPSAASLHPEQASPHPVAAPPPFSCPNDMATIPASTFPMGSEPGDADEKPVHEVTLSTYCIDVREVTVAAYKACSELGECASAPLEPSWEDATPKERKSLRPLCNANDADKKSNHPVNCVSWDMAQSFCKWSSKRLPTEAEWEYAARGNDGRTYPWGNEEPDATRLNGCGAECLVLAPVLGIPPRPMYRGNDTFASTAPVGSFPKGRSPFGLLDVAGNVWEWVADYSGPYTGDRATDPRGPATGKRRVVRGGAFNGVAPSWVRPTQRYSDLPDTLSHAYGFRCAKSAP